MWHILSEFVTVFCIWLGVDILLVWMWVCLCYICRRKEPNWNTEFNGTTDDGVQTWINRGKVDQ